MILLVTITLSWNALAKIMWVGVPTHIVLAIYCHACHPHMDGIR